MKKMIVLLLMFSAVCTFGQTRSASIDQQIEEIMKAREEMIKSLLNDSGFQNFDKRFEDLIQRFEKNSFDSAGVMGGAVIGEYDWRETDTHQIFVLKVKQIKDRPLTIKIEKGSILLKGDVESVEEAPAKKTKRITKVHFERSFSIPAGVDQGNPEFENKEGELKILFKKLSALKRPINNKKALPPTPSPGLEPRTPIDSTPSDITI